MRKHNEPSLEAERDALREEVARLNQEIRRRQMELDILKKAEEIIKKDPGISITEFQLPAGKVWLSPVVDCFDGKVISWSLSTRPDAELVNTMLDSAVETLNAGERPVIHSDRGGHYRWPGWLERVNAAGLIRSMSRKGCSPDNAACEGFFGRLKTEMYYGRKWSGITPEKLMQHVDAYIRWYNERRIKLSLGAVSHLRRSHSLRHGRRHTRKGERGTINIVNGTPIVSVN